VRLNSRR